MFVDLSKSLMKMANKINEKKMLFFLSSLFFWGGRGFRVQ